jgi:hypothetical protein
MNDSARMPSHLISYAQPSPTGSGPAVAFIGASVRGSRTVPTAARLRP